MMKQLQFYKYATFALLAINLSIIGFLFFTHGRPPHPGEGENLFMRAAEMMKLDPQQNEQFQEFAGAHAQKMRSINERQRDLLRPYFQSLIDPSLAIDSSAVLAEVQKLEAEKVEATYQHFAEVKAMLKPEQQPYFEEFMHQALRMILLEPNNAPPPRDGKGTPPRN